MSLAADSIFLPPPADSDADVRCLRCEYRLRGLARDGNCPECGAAIELSWRRHEFLLAHGWAPLAMASPKWLRAMGSSAALFAGGGAGLVIAHGAMAMLPPGPAASSSGAIAAMLTSLAVLAVATWLAGRREPGGRCVAAAATGHTRCRSVLADLAGRPVRAGADLHRPADRILASTECG